MKCEKCNFDKELEVKKRQFEIVEECIDLIGKPK